MVIYIILNRKNNQNYNFNFLIKKTFLLKLNRIKNINFIYILT